MLTFEVPLIPGLDITLRPNVNWSVTSGDFNGDGKADLVVSQSLIANAVLPHSILPNAPRIGIFYSIADKIAAGTTTLTINQADVIMGGGNEDSGFGILPNRPGLDANRDGVDDLAILGRNSKLLVAPGKLQSRFTPADVQEISTTGIAAAVAF